MSFQYQMAVVLLIAAIPAPAAGREESNWRNLDSLKPGQRIGLIQKDGKRIDGTFASVSDSDISIRTGNVIKVPKEAVARVYRHPRLNRGWHILIGTGAGVAVGAVLNSTIGQYLRNEAHDTSPAVWIGAGAAVGAGLGAASGGGDKTIYRNP